MQLVGKVAKMQLDKATPACDRVGDIADGVGRETAHNKPCAFAGKLMRDRLADTGASPGNDCDLIL